MDLAAADRPDKNFAKVFVELFMPEIRLNYVPLNSMLKPCVCFAKLLLQPYSALRLMLQKWRLSENLSDGVLACLAESKCIWQPGCQCPLPFTS